MTDQQQAQGCGRPRRPVRWLACWLVLAGATASAMPAPIELTAGASQIDLATATEYLLDPTGSVDLDQVTAPPWSEAFQPVGPQALFAGSTNGRLWLRLRVHAPAGVELPAGGWCLVIGRDTLWEAICYLRLADGDEPWREQRVGLKPTHAGDTNRGELMFQLLLQPGQTLDCYVRIADQAPLLIPLHAETYAHHLLASGQRRLLLGIYYGIMVTMILYNLALYPSIRHPSVIWYALHVGFLTIHFVGFNGLLVELAPGLVGHLAAGRVTTFALGMSLLCTLQFARTFLETPRTAPLADQALVAFIVLATVGVLGLSPWAPFALVSRFYTIFGLLALPVLTLTGGFCWLRGFRPAWLFMLAWISFGVGGVVFALTWNGVVPYTATGLRGWQLASAVEALLFSLALSERVERLRREREAFRVSERRLRGILDFCPFPIAITGIDDNRLRYLNRAGQEQFGAVPGEDIGSSVVEFHIDPADRERSLALLRTEGRQEAAEMEFRAAGGRHFWALVTSTLFRYEGEEVVLSAILDITDRRQAETERAALEARLQQAAKMAAVGQLSAGVAHNFNNLLTVILGHCDLLSVRGGDHGARDRACGAIRDAATEAAELTDALLAFSRRQMITAELLDLNGLVAQTAPMLAPLLGEDIELRLQLADGLPPVMAEASGLQQVIMNLAENSRDAMPGGGQLVIATGQTVLTGAAGEVDLPPGGYLTLRVGDTGEGIAPDLIERVFEPFFTTRGMSERTGLGLSTVYGIVKQAGGDLVCQSSPAGTTMLIYLPAGEAATTRDRPTLSRGATDEEAFVLLVEDEPSLRLVARESLELAGYTVLDAPDAAEALTLAATLDQPVALLVTDVMLPGMKGPELAECLRPTQPGMAVLYISGFTEPDLLDRGLLQPGSDFLPKPFRPRQLQQKAREVLQGVRHG